MVLEVHHQYLVLRPTDSFDGAQEVLRLRLGGRAHEKVVGSHDESFRLSTVEKLLEAGGDVSVAITVRAFRSFDHAEFIILCPGPLEVQLTLVPWVNVDSEDGFLYTHTLLL